MERRQMDDLLAGGLDRAVELMAVSAHNSFRFGGKNSIRIVTAGRDDLQDIAEYCLSLGDMSPLGARDGRHLIELMKEPMALMVMGDKRRSNFNFNCGACGYRSCAEMNAAEEVESLTANGPSCQFRNINLNMGIKAVFSPRFTKSRIWDICRKYGCTTFSLLGGMMAGIYNEPEKPSDADNPVKVVLSAGTPESIWDGFEKRFGVKILEWYGAVEGGFAFKSPGKGPIGSFGKPVPGVMEFKVVDDDDVELPAGKTGELICRMVRGETKVDYLGLPDASQEKTKGGWLRTGDMVHKDEQGWYFFDYRKGSELRRAGDFIQPSYVESVVGKHPSISEVCVYGIPAASGSPGESDLVAAV